MGRLARLLALAVLFTFTTGFLLAAFAGAFLLARALCLASAFLLAFAVLAILLTTGTVLLTAVSLLLAATVLVGADCVLVTFVRTTIRAAITTLTLALRTAAFRVSFCRT